VDGSGTSYWWRSLGRNKKSVCVDLRAEEGRELIREMLPHFDALVENFRPGRMEEWGLSPEACWGINPDLVYTRVSGYGQTGPYASRPGFASACEAMGGLRYINGFEDRPSVRPNISLGDTLAGERAALGTVLALLARERGLGADDGGSVGGAGAMAGVGGVTGAGGAGGVGGGAGGDAAAAAGGDQGADVASVAANARRGVANGHGDTMETSKRGLGQVVDVSIVESVFGMLEGILPEYSGAGAVRGPSGSSITGIVPTGTYPCGDGKYVVIGANSDSLFKRLCSCMGRDDLGGDDESFGDNTKRVQRQGTIDEAIAAWTRSCPTAEDACAALEEAGIPNGMIFSIKDIVEDRHVQERGMIETVTIGGGPNGLEQRELDIPAVSCPRLSATPGGTAWPGRDAPGDDTGDVLRELVGKSEAEVAALAAKGVVHGRGV